MPRSAPFAAPNTAVPPVGCVTSCPMALAARVPRAIGRGIFCALDCPFRRLEARNAHFERFALCPTPQMLYLCLPGNRWEQALAGAGCARQGGGERENPQPPSPAPKAPVPFYYSTKCAGAGGCPTSPRRWDATQKPMEAGLAPGAAICCAVQCGRKPKLIALATLANAEGGCGTRRKPPNAWYHSA